MSNPEPLPDPSVPAAISAEHTATLEAVATNATRFDARRKLLAARADLDHQIEVAESELGMDKIRVASHPARTDTNEYVCEVCSLDWLGITKLPCANCYPIRLLTADNPRSQRFLNFSTFAEDWQSWTTDLLHQRAANIRSEAAQAPARLTRDAAEIESIVNRLVEDAREIDLLADGITSGELRRCRWVPLAQASVFHNRIYLLTRINFEGQPVGRPKLCRLDPSFGWTAESLNEMTDEHYRRDDADAAVFLLPGHP